MTMFITDKFKEYEKATLASCKKSEADNYKEKFSQTELFDISRVMESKITVQLEETEKEIYGILPLKFFSLPFKYCYVNVISDSTSTRDANSELFIEEVNPELLSGELQFTVNSIIDKTNYSGTIPFTIKLEDTQCTFSIDKQLYKKYTDIMIKELTVNTERMRRQLSKIDFSNRGEDGEKERSEVEAILSDAEKRCQEISKSYKGMMQYLVINALVNTQKVFEKLSKCEVVCDHDNRSQSTEYYSFKDKRKPTVKITNRPIYYVVSDTHNTNSTEEKEIKHDKYGIKTISKLEYTHSFKVRGHWRRLPQSSTSSIPVGKDRAGNYHVEGFTWVTDYIKGEGELLKRTRILK